MSDLVEFKKKLKKLLSDENVGAYLFSFVKGGEYEVIGEGENRDLALLNKKADIAVTEQIENW